MELAAGVPLTVVRTWFPSTCLGLRLDHRPAVPLGWGPYSVCPDRDPWLVEGSVADAAAQVWASEGELFCRVGDAAPAGLVPGLHVPLRRGSLEVTVVPAIAWTNPVEPEAAVRIVLGTGVVWLRGMVAEAELGGHSARVLTALHDAGGRADWLRVAEAVWPSERVHKDPVKYQDDLYAHVLYRLDRQLRRHGLRDDLVRRGDGDLWLADGLLVEDLRGRR
jgi:hypothetical protein